MRADVTLRAVVLAGLLAAIALLGGCGWRGFEAVHVLNDIAAGAGPSRLKRTTPAPRRTAIGYRAGGRDYRADVYLPGGEETARASLLLVPGVAPRGRDDPRLVAFANTLARARFRVLVPDMPNLRAQRITPGDIRHIGDGIAYLAASPIAQIPETPAPPGPIGIAAVSYAVGPALLAALGAEPPGRVAFLLAIGGYYDSVDVITFFTTGYYRERADGKLLLGRPNAFGKWVFVLANAHRLEDAHDRALLRQMARRRLADNAAPIDDLAGALGPEGQAVYALMVNTAPDRVEALVARLPAGVRADIEALDISRRDLGRLKTRLILVHGRDDAVIPYTESLHLAAAAPAGRASLTIVGDLMHADLGGIGLWDAIRLWRAVLRLLRERDGAAG